LLGLVGSAAPRWLFEGLRRDRLEAALAAIVTDVTVGGRAFLKELGIFTRPASISLKFDLSAVDVAEPSAGRVDEFHPAASALNLACPAPSNLGR
jgi:hypothetical protein